ncbi:MAG: Imm26 family immunity protein [Caldilineaceae bacterium]
MGWWFDKFQGQELVQGDAPYDILSQAFKEISQEYLQDWNRKPTLHELIRSIEIVLAATLDEFILVDESIELVKLTAKTKKRRRLQPYHVGDFFAIPLSNGSYAYGRILSDIQQERMGMLVGIYNQVTEHIIHSSSIIDRSLCLLHSIAVMRVG